MAIAVSMAFTSVGPPTANEPIRGILTVTNNGSNTVSVRNIQLYQLPMATTPLNQGGANVGLHIDQPQYLTPNVAPGDDYPNITAAATSYFPFTVVAFSPNTPGASPNAPSALHYNEAAFPSGNPIVRLQCDVRTYDSVAATNVVGSATLETPIKSAVAPFPVPAGGALQFNKTGSDLVNLFFF